MEIDPELNKLMENTFEEEEMEITFLKFDIMETCSFECCSSHRFGCSLWISTCFENENHCFYKSYNKENKLKYQIQDAINGFTYYKFSLPTKRKILKTNKAPLRDTAYILKFHPEMKPFTIYLYSCNGCISLLELGNFKLIECMSNGEKYLSRFLKARIDPSKIPKDAAIMISDLFFHKQLILNDIIEVSFQINGSYKEKEINFKNLNKKIFNLNVCSTETEIIKMLNEKII